jgi:hypothetical protein
MLGDDSGRRRKKESLSFSCIDGVGTGHSPTPVLVTAKKLHPGTKYIFWLFAENVEGGQGEGLTEKFETLAKPPKKPHHSRSAARRRTP